MFRLLLHSAREVVQVVSHGEEKVCGADMDKLASLQAPGIGLSIVVNHDGNIACIGTDDEVREKYGHASFKETVNASGMTVIPGLIDAHTHPVWAGDRIEEFAMKLRGAKYMDIHAAGGGIHFTVDCTRLAREDDLLKSFLARLQQMLAAGTTTVEAKSGYGLDVQTELKILHVIERAKALSPVEISTTFCGAHAIPRGLTAEDATKAVIEEQLSKLKEEMEAERLHVDSIDVFCEKSVFELDHSRRILQAGRKMGFRLNFHADELYPLGGVEMGAEMGAEAISHLEEASDAGIRAMANAGTVAVLLPTTAYVLHLKPPPVRKMIVANVPVALGTDFNPNIFCLSMPLTMHLACVTYGMTTNEALVASTLNAAAALGKSATHGSLEPGKVGDMLVLQAPRWDHLIYQMGGHGHVIKHVIKRGLIVHTNPDAGTMI